MTAARQSSSMYSLKNIRMIELAVAPFTLRTAISLRRYSQWRVTSEKTPKTEMTMQTIETKSSSLSNAFSD